MFCIVCGRQAEVGTFCGGCYAKRFSLFDIGDFELHECTGCSRLEEDLEHAIRRRIKARIPLRIAIGTKRQGNRVIASVSGTGRIPQLRREKREEKTVTIIVRKRKCATCVKLLGGYYNAVIQVRGPQRDRILKRLGKELPGDARIEAVRGGYDVKFLAKAQAEKAARALQPRGITRSFKLVGEKKGKKLIRNFYSVR